MTVTALVFVKYCEIELKDGNDKKKVISVLKWRVKVKVKVK